MSEHAIGKIKDGREDGIAIARDEAEVQMALREVVDRGSRTSLRDLADRIAALTPDVPQTDSTDLVRGDPAR